MLSLVKAGYGDFEVVSRMSVEDVLDAIEFEEMRADIEVHKYEQARQNNGNN